MVSDGIVAPSEDTVAKQLKGDTVCNAGLRFDRYLPIWTGELDNLSRAEKLGGLLRDFVEEFNKRQGAAQWLRAHHWRLDRIMEACGGRTKTFRTSWRVAAGLGNEHPTENGFIFDPVLGVPVLPGSSVKGLCRAAADLLWNDEAETERLFGPKQIDREAPANVGAIIFHDAYPKVWPKLCVDIINNHHPAYYRYETHEGPTETESPQPVYFLALEANTEFVFRYRARSGSSEDLGRIEELLTTALDLLGIGAKTAVGYGFMNEAD